MTEEQPRLSVTITHTAEEGTIARGDTREAKEVLKRLGFRWSSHCQFWFRIKSRGQAKSTLNPHYAKQQLELAGFDCLFDLQECDTETAREVKVRVLNESADRAEARAERATGVADAGYAAARQIMSFIPPGQPILVGHHSEGRHRRDLKRIDSNMSKAVEAGKLADRLEWRVNSLRAQAERLEQQPVTLPGYQGGKELITKQLKKALGASKVCKTAEGKGARLWAIYWISVGDVLYQGYLNSEGFQIYPLRDSCSPVVKFGEDFIKRIVDFFINSYGRKEA